MKLGISSYTYTWAVGVPGSPPEDPLLVCGLLEKALKKGIDLVQVADNIPLEELSEDELELLRDFSEANRIELETGGRGLTPEHTMKCLKVAHTLNSGLLRMVIDSRDFEPSIAEVKSILKDLLPEFQRTGIKLAIENHDRLKAREFEEIILSAGSEWIGICLDSVNSMGAGEGFGTVADILIPYTVNLHIKDFTVSRLPHKMGFAIEGRPAGKGMLDIPGLIERTSETGICRSAILELWTPPETELQDTILKEQEWADVSINYLKKIIC